MNTKTFADSELVLNPDGSIYHLKLLPEHVADTVLLVGDQGRVNAISRYFDEIEYQIQNREFVTHTGWYRGKRLTALSTGIGTDNIDIVLNELHAVVNIDLNQRTIKPNHTRLNLIRIGTSGSLHLDVPAGSYIVAEYGLGFDGLVYYYPFHPEKDETNLAQQVYDHLAWDQRLSTPYVVKGADELIARIGKDMVKGITATATGFYGPQGRRLGLELGIPDMNDRLTSFESGTHRITNFEMETSALYGLGKMLGHNCCTCCLALANRARKEYLNDYHTAMDQMIKTILERLVD
jgi:uridine phosphorylase